MKEGSSECGRMEIVLFNMYFSNIALFFGYLITLLVQNSDVKKRASRKHLNVLDSTSNKKNIKEKKKIPFHNH